MANQLEEAMTRLAEIQQSHAATSISYRRGGATPLSIAATRGAAGQQVDMSTGELTWNDQDWIIPVSVLTLGEPERGDTIEIDDEVYEVLPPQGLPCWRWNDNHRIKYRIFTKRTQ